MAGRVPRAAQRYVAASNTLPRMITIRKTADPRLRWVLFIELHFVELLHYSAVPIQTLVQQVQIIADK
ncbi:hypothetical protein ACFDR1_26570 [Bradyrhizobium sp. 1AS5L]|jgi:hypothetical protein